MKRLFDLVKVRDEALKVAFYFGLGNTLVAADLEQASRIAYGGDKRWSRVVTMQVCERSFITRAPQLRTSVIHLPGHNVPDCFHFVEAEAAVTVEWQPESQ